PRRDCFVLVLPSSLLLFFFYSALAHRDLHSFPTRRSSDLNAAKLYAAPVCPCSAAFRCHFAASASSRVTLRPDSYRTPRLYCARSEEHTSELQSRFDLVCRLLLEKKKKYIKLDL